MPSSALPPHRVPRGVEYSDSYGHRAEQNRLIDRLRRAGLSLNMPGDGLPNSAGIRDNRALVVGRDGAIDRRIFPDVSYIGADGRRVNVEIDTVLRRSRGKQRALIRRDPGARHVFLIVDPRTGRLLRRFDYRPERDRGRQTARATRRVDDRLPRPAGASRPARARVA